MRVVTAPSPVPSNLDLFLAGGITNCPDWQSELIARFQGFPGVVANPRRATKIDMDGEMGRTQIAWEYDALHRSAKHIFWFPEESICPIALYELGAHAPVGKRLFVGTAPQYPRRFDVVEQMRLVRPDVVVHDNIDDMLTAFFLAY